MEGTQAIINKIKEDAEKKASSIIDNANFEGNLQKKEAEKWAKEYIDTQSDILKKQCEEIVERRKTVAELDVRKYILLKKQQLIENVIEKVYNEMVSMPKDKYLSYVEKNITDYSDEGDSIVLSSDGVLTEEDVKKLAVVERKKLTVSSRRGDFIGGVKLIGKTSDKDLSFKSVIDDRKDEMVSLIAEKLFD